MNPDGEVHTPPKLVNEIYKLLIPLLEPLHHINLYEPGVGPGVFYNEYTLKDKTTYNGCDINYTHPPPIIRGDFFEQDLSQYDVILGNLPFNQGIVHTPCNKTTKKKSKTIWTSMLKKCINHIKPNGYGAFIIPCIWLKPDREHIYELLTSKHILYLKTYDCKTSNRLFSYKCQTPICYIIFQNKIRETNTIHIYDETKFIDFPLTDNYCIPTENISIIMRSHQFVNSHKKLPIIKIANTNKITETNNIEDPYSITSVILPNIIKGFHSKEQTSYYNIPKIILAHKRLPIPLKDLEGKYGLYGRDKYIVVGERLNEVYDFLLNPLIQKLIKSFTIRMNFYEKYIFDYIPDPRYCDVEQYIKYIKN